MKNSKCCAFARACKRQVTGIKGAYFFRSIAWLEFEDKIVRLTGQSLQSPGFINCQSLLSRKR